MPRKRQQKPPEIRRAEILRSAEKLFITNGINETRIEDIAKDADIGKGTLYLYFKNKDDMLLGLGKAFIDYFVERLEFHAKDCRQDDLSAMLDAWLYGCLDAFYDKADLHELAFHKSPQRPIKHRHDNPAVKFLAELFTRHQYPDPNFLAAITFNIVHGTVDFTFANPPVIEKQAMFDKVRPLLHRLIVEG